ncbi:MAG TPA: ATP-binding protein [Polyangia bacterium]|jgi:hypothetical protein|nr:ATP-binding protein [Polyangia bacterium]
MSTPAAPSDGAREMTSPAPDLIQAPLDARSHLALHLERISLRLDRLHHHHLASPPPGAATGDEARHAARLEQLDEDIAAQDHALADRMAHAAEGEGAALPLAELCERFDLSPAALELLVAAAAPALDVHLGRRCARILGEQDRAFDVAFLIELLAYVGPSRFDADTLAAELGPAAPLVRWRLVRLGAVRGWGTDGPTLERPVMVPDRVLVWMKGERRFEPERFGHSARLHPSAPHAMPDTLPETLQSTLRRVLFREQDGRRLPLLVTGPALVGKTEAVVTAAGLHGRAALEVDLESVTLTSQPAELLLDLVREARLHDAVLLLRRAERLSELRGELRHALFTVLDEGAVSIALTATADVPELLRRATGVQSYRLELPSAALQARLWDEALPAPARAAQIATQEIVRRYHLSPGDIREAAQQALGQAHAREGDGLVTLDDVVGAVRDRLRHRLGDIAELLTTPLGWADMVLCDEVKGRIDELLAAVRFQATVMDEWGLGRKVSYGRATSALFSGPPGTGKTMVAMLIAKALGLELFRVDLSRVVSKWVGETEKNLGRAFDEAKSAQAVLLFDEADALFAKRTDVKSSNDRYANLEVNYLLQRLESFEGIVLLTTNNQSSIDDAFRRRLRFRIDFPMPDEEERARLWQTMLPQGAPREERIDFAQLGRKYEMSGGYIKNAVMRAAYLAAASPERRITQKILFEAARREWEDMGKLAMG